MKKNFYTFVLVTLLLSIPCTYAFAYDIAVKNADGVTIYYNYINGDRELAVTSGIPYKDYVVIPEDVTFKNITRKVTSIGESAFSNCSGLTSVVIPNSVTSIEKSAFYGCSGLTSITIPNSVTSIGGSAFNRCSGLTSITIPNSVTSIGDAAFVGCRGLTSITIPNSVTSIGESAFHTCKSLTSVVIGSGVTSIGYEAFSGANLKKTIWLTNTPPSGYNYARGTINYVSNDQFDISNKVVYKFLSSYFEVDGIRYVPVSPSERTCDAIDCVYDETSANTIIPSTVTYNGITLSVRGIQPYACYANKYIQALNCDFSNEIFDYTFFGCTNMKSMTLGNKITSIGNYAFQDCKSLLSVKIPDGVVKLGKYSFWGCTELSDLIIGSKVTQIDQYAFKDCSSLPQITIPKAVKLIDNYVFSGCKGLNKLTIADREDELKLGSNDSSPLFADCPTSSRYGYSPFYRNTTLKTVEITDRETEISDYEFYGCTSLQSFTVGDGVKKFGDWAFSGCSSLKSLSFGSHLGTIGKEAFSDCASVTKIQSKAAVPPSCGSQALDDFNKWTCTLYVPNGCKAAYQSADQWKEFFYIEEGTWGGEDPYNPDNKKCATPTIRYENGKLTFNCATSGAICQSTITDEDIRSYSLDEVQLSVTYHISVYATKEGYENSDEATATLCWIDVEPKTEGIANGVANVRARAVLIQSNGSVLTVNGAESGTPINVYDTAGRKVGSTEASGETTSVNTQLRSGQVGIVRIGEKAVKILVK